jgi:hypothetical protein
MSEGTPKPEVKPEVPPEGTQNPEKEKKTPTKAEEEAKAVENAFPKEDATESQQEETKPPENEKGTPLWAKDPNEKKKDGKNEERPPSQTQILLYIARETHLERIMLEAFLNKVFSTVQKAQPTVVNNATTAQQPDKPAQVVTQAPVVATVKPEKQKLIEEALKDFIPELLEVDGTKSNMFYVVRFRKFAGAENFAKISTACRAMGGSYVSAGKESHFTIPKQ